MKETDNKQKVNVRGKYNGLLLTDEMLAHKGLSLRTKLVFLVLTKYVNGKGDDGFDRCTIKQSDIAKKLNVTIRTVLTGINQLIKIEVIGKEMPTLDERYNGYCSTYFFLKDSFCNANNYKPFEPSIPEGYSEIHTVINGKHIIKTVHNKDLPKSYRNHTKNDCIPGEKTSPVIINNINTENNNIISNITFSKEKVKRDSLNPSTSVTTSCGKIKLNRRINNQQSILATTQQLKDNNSLSKAATVRAKCKEMRENTKIPEIVIPAKVQEIMDYWSGQEIDGKKLFIPIGQYYTTKIKIINGIKDLLKTYPAELIGDAIQRFALAALDKNYLPEEGYDYKLRLQKKISLNDFLFGKKRDKDGQIVSNGLFKQYLEESEPKSLIKPKQNNHKELTARLEERYQSEISGGLELSRSKQKKIDRHNAFIEASDRLYEFYTVNKDSFGYMSQTEMADMLFDAVLAVAGNKTTSFTVNRLCRSDITFTEVLPAFAFQQGYANDNVPMNIKPIYADEDQETKKYQSDIGEEEGIYAKDAEDDRSKFSPEEIVEQESEWEEKRRKEAVFEEKAKKRGEKFKNIPITRTSAVRGYGKGNSWTIDDYLQDEEE